MRRAIHALFASLLVTAMLAGTLGATANATTLSPTVKATISNALRPGGSGAVVGNYWTGNGYQQLQGITYHFPQLSLMAFKQDGTVVVVVNNRRMLATVKLTLNRIFLYAGTSPAWQGYAYELIIRR